MANLHRTPEDDDWLITYVHRLGARTAEFVVMDPQDFGRGHYLAPNATAPAPAVRLPRQLGQRPLGSAAHVNGPVRSCRP